MTKSNSYTGGGKGKRRPTLSEGRREMKDAVRKRRSLKEGMRAENGQGGSGKGRRGYRKKEAGDQEKGGLQKRISGS